MEFIWFDLFWNADLNFSKLPCDCWLVFSRQTNDYGFKADMTLDRTPLIRVTAMPADTNPYGGVFGGWLMSLQGVTA